MPLTPRTRATARAVFAILTALLALWVARGFLSALAWAALIAVATWPLYTRFAALISTRPSGLIAPLLFTLLSGAILILPIILMINQVAAGSDAVVRWIAELKENQIPVPHWLTRLPMVSEYLVEWWRSNFSNPQDTLAWLRHVDAESLTAWTGALGGELLSRLALFCLTFLALFFMLRDGTVIAHHIIEAADRLLGDPGERLAGKIADAIRGTVIGTVGIAVGQGALIGIVYVLAGVPNPLLFMLLTIVFGMLPFGAWLVFTGAALVLFVQQGGSVLAAALVFGSGAAVMLAASLVWPVLVGGTARLPFLLALIGIFGGLQTFGLIGLFVGPVIMAALLTIWREWLPARPCGSGTRS